MFDFIGYIFSILFSKDRYFYKTIHRLFGLYPNNIELYKLALIHKSASVQTEDGVTINNERLEFLGDAIIEAIVSDMIYIEFPYENEGFLTQLRSKVVSRTSLNNVADKLGLTNQIIAQTNLPASRKHIHGDAFEAMIGAIYLDKGYDFTNRLLINNIFAKYIDLDSVIETETDFKSRLIEWCQKNRCRASIDSKLGDVHDSEHNRQFETTISIDGKSLSYGVGDSKKEAEQRAAKNALEKLKSRVSVQGGGASRAARNKRPSAEPAQN